ncbi:MAG: copper resistance protein NlpE [Tannerellaceae bacterium]|nr:copper resistance protein NlpE [Tannerellaceae bacterium]
MKNITLILTLLLLLTVSCKRNKNKISYEYEPPESIAVQDETAVLPVTVNIQDSLVVKEGMGDVIELHFEGVLPAADGPGIQYDLDIWKQEKSEDGVFWMLTTYLGDENEEDHSFVTEGRLSIMNRTHKGNNETIYELSPLDGSTPLYFYENNDGLTMLDQQMGHISSETNHNYTLERTK